MGDVVAFGCKGNIRAARVLECEKNLHGLLTQAIVYKFLCFALCSCANINIFRVC